MWGPPLAWGSMEEPWEATDSNLPPRAVHTPLPAVVRLRADIHHGPDLWGRRGLHARDRTNPVNGRWCREVVGNRAPRVRCEAVAAQLRDVLNQNTNQLQAHSSFIGRPPRRVRQDEASHQPWRSVNMHPPACSRTPGERSWHITKFGGYLITAAPKRARPSCG